MLVLLDSDSFGRGTDHPWPMNIRDSARHTRAVDPGLQRITLRQYDPVKAAPEIVSGFPAALRYS
jgi:hypothetical protein